MPVAIRAVEPVSNRQRSMYGEALKYLDDISDLRDGRIGAARNGLPPLFWKTVGGMILLLVLLAAQVTPSRKQLWSLAVIAATIGLLLSVVVVVDAPFSGESGVEPDALNKVLVLIQART